MADQPKRPEYEQNQEDCPEHKIVLIRGRNIAAIVRAGNKASRFSRSHQQINRYPQSASNPRIGASKTNGRPKRL
jgi:hypothetical protein